MKMCNFASRSELCRQKEEFMSDKSNSGMMDWARLLSNKRFGQETRHSQRFDDRSEFRRDYDRLVFSAPFRRLQNKTQVFPLPGSVFVHNRLTHSLEVASVGHSLGRDIAQKILEREPALASSLLPEMGTVVSAACLAHDLGNPPFGHSGEKAIQSFFLEGDGMILKDLVAPDVWDDITRFEGNANAFRLLTHRFVGRREGGFVMTYSTLASIVKYPFSSSMAGSHGKFGFFSSERPYFERIADDLGILCKKRTAEGVVYARYPLVYLVEAADDICYEIMDIEDAHKLKILTYDETRDLFMRFFDEEAQAAIQKRIEDEQITDDNEKVGYMRARVVGLLQSECVSAFMRNEEAILSGTFEGSLIDHISPLPLEAYMHCTKLSLSRIYNSKLVLDIELSGYKIMATLMHQMVDAVMHPERFYSKQLIKRVSSQYDINAERLEDRIMAVLDYISGMTDVYALDVYQKINGMSLPIL